MNDRQMAEGLSPEQYAALKRSLELGKWPDGRLVSAEQRATCMQALIYWEARHVASAQRTGFIDRGAKAKGETCAEPDVLRFTDD